MLAPSLAASLQIRTSAEGAAGAGHDHDLHRIVRVRAIECCDQLVAHATGEGVHPVGPVKRDRQNAVVELVANVFEVHAPAVTRTALKRK
jgi:hypothetical protein